MKKYTRAMIFVFGVAFLLGTFAVVAPANAYQQVLIPYGYVGEGWDSVIVVSNISTKTINPYILVRNGDELACAPIGELQAGEIFVNTFGALTGWCLGLTPPIPGVFQVYVGATELESGDDPFGVAITINNGSFGGFSFQQYKSEYVSIPSLFIACACTL